MLGLVVTILFSLEVAYFAIQNAQGVNIRFINYQMFGIPLYVVVISSILIGVLMSWFIAGVNSISYFFKLRSKDGAIQKEKKELVELKAKIRRLELENDRLRGINAEMNDEVVDSEKEKRSKKLSPSIFGRILATGN